MQVSVESISSIERRVKIQVPAEEINKQIDARLREIGKQVSLKGFRPGRIPFSVLRQRYGKQATADIIQQTAQSSLQEAVQKESLRIAASPRIEEEPLLDNENGLEINAIIEVYPDLDPIEVGEIKIDRPDVAVTDADIDEMLETLKRQRVEWTDVERMPKAGDQALVEYVAETEDGRVPGVGKQRLAVIIGKSGFEAMEKVVSKMAAGDSKSVKMEFPADYREPSLAGKKAQLELEVTKVQEGAEPEIDEEFVKSFGIDSGDADDLKKEIRNNLERELQQAVTTQLKTQLADRLLEMHENMKCLKALSSMKLTTCCSRCCAAPRWK